MEQPPPSPGKHTEEPKLARVQTKPPGQELLQGSAHTLMPPASAMHRPDAQSEPESHDQPSPPAWLGPRTQRPSTQVSPLAQSLLEPHGIPITISAVALVAAKSLSYANTSIVVEPSLASAGA